jgi:Fe-Mn family superoxide dismutase
MENINKILNGAVYPFSLLPLPYGYSALEPYIDTKTMHAHHDLHLKAYVDKLNGLIATNPEFMGKSLTQILQTPDLDIDIERNAGGVYNHLFYFDELRPSTGQITVGISPHLTQLVNDSFGGMSAMRSKFNDVATSLFGSGYIWIVKNAAGRLELIATENQMTPLTAGLTPILCVDLWEHAYYLKNLNNRTAYLNAFWDIVDWAKFSQKV